MDQGATLLKLQDLELEIARADKKLDEMPEKRAILEVRVKRREIDVLGSKTEELVHRLQAEVKKNEDEATTTTEKIDAEQARMMSGDITNAKEVQHLTREVDALKRRREKLEMEQLQLMERVEKAKGQSGKVDQALTQLDSKEATLTEEFTAKGGELQTQVEVLKKEAEVAVSAVDPELLARFRGLQESRGGTVAAGLLLNSACTACRMELPAEKVEALKVGPEIGTCPHCHRILVVRAVVEDE